MNVNNKKAMLGILGAMMFFANGDNYAVAAMLGSIAEDLNLEISAAALSVSGYMLAFGLFTIFFGPLSDRFGKAKVIKTAALGTACFSILGGGSLQSALSGLFSRGKRFFCRRASAHNHCSGG